MNKIKKFLPEIIFVVVLALLIAGFAVATFRLNDNRVYEGNYVGGNSTDVYVNMTVEWIESVRDISGVEEVEFDPSLDLKSSDQEAILKEEGWYLADIDIQANTEAGYRSGYYENVLLHDGFSELTDSLAWQVEIQDEKAVITHSITGEGVSGDSDYDYLDLVWTAFSGNGATFLYYFGVGGGGSTYLEKNGTLTFYNLQIVQAVCIALMSVLGLVYMVYAFFKNKTIYIWASAIIMLIMFAVTSSQSSIDEYGEWRSVYNEDEFVIVPNYADEVDTQVVFDTETDSIKVNSVENQGEVLPYDIDSDEFKEEYELITVISGYKVYPFAILIAVLAGCAFGAVLTINKSRGNTQIIPEAMNESAWADFYGKYVVGKVKYLSDAFTGMEEYFEQNAGNEEIIFLSTEYSYDGEVIESPQYAVNNLKKAPYPGALVEKRHIITVVGGEEPLDYELNFGKKNAYLIKYMDGVITIVYEIQKKEG